MDSRRASTATSVRIEDGARFLVSAASRLRRTRRVVLALAGLGIAVLLTRQIAGGPGELAGAARRLAHPAIGWIVAAVAFELLSYVFYATAQRRLLRAAGNRLGLGWLASLAVSAQALMNFLPAGYVAANLLNFRELGRRGCASGVATWTLVMTSVLYIGALACLTLLGGELAGSHPPGGLGRAQFGAAGFLVVVIGLGITVRFLRRRGVIRLPRTWRARVAAVPASGQTLAGAGAIFAFSWLADAACLVAALGAVGANPGWELVPLAYCAAQLVSFLPVTPGGLGLVEGSLTVALMAGGEAGTRVLAAVLLYRIISYWSTLPVGGLGYLVVRRYRPMPALAPCALPALTSLERDGERRDSEEMDRTPGSDRPVLVLGG